MSILPRLLPATGAALISLATRRGSFLSRVGGKCKTTDLANVSQAAREREGGDGEGAGRDSLAG